MATPTENWPKGFLIQLHEEAVREGLVFIRPISREDAESMKKRIYRIRRRSDTSMAAFIKPEFHLVMVGAWEEANGGQLPIIYDRRPDGKPMPAIVPATTEEKDSYSPAAMPILDSAPVPDALLSELQTGIDPGQINDFVESLRKKKDV